MMKRFFFVWLAAAAVLVAGCKKPEVIPDPGQKLQQEIQGVWELTGVSTKATVGSVQVNVYLDFDAQGSFTLYQKLGEGRYSRFTGSYKLDENTKLSGTYSNKEAWGPYTVSLEGSTLRLTTESGRETDTYTKVQGVPDSVLGNLY